jgi:hypothetical protein
LKHANHALWKIEQGLEANYFGAGYFGAGPSPAWAARSGPVVWLCRPLIRYARLRYLRGMERLIDQESVPPFARPRPANIVSQDQSPKWWQFARRFDSTFLSGLTRAAESGYEYVSILNAAELAVALRRFRLDQGQYPASLDALAPQYVARLPIDPFTGRPPEYIRQGAGFELRAHRARPIMSGTTDERLFEWKIPR